MPADPSGAATVLLVHGAYHGAWCWDPVRARLTELGVPSLAPELPLTGYAADVAAVRAAAERAGRGPLVVVAHSYSGIVVADAAHRADRLVFVAARMPLPGESQTELSPRWHVPGLGDSTAVDEAGWARVGPAAREVFYADCPPGLADEAMSRLRPMRSAVPARPLDEPAWLTAPTAYVVCRRDRVVRVDRQRERAALVDEHHELDCGHSPFLAVPGDLARLLAEQARKAASAPAPHHHADRTRRTPPWRTNRKCSSSEQDRPG